MEPVDVEPAKRYRHQALDTSTRQIRLIKLLPGSSKQPQCDISVFDLDSAPPFLALSYTWGPPSPQCDILVNGEPFSIRENLFQFFQAYLMINGESHSIIENLFRFFQGYLMCKAPVGGFYNWDSRVDAYLWIDQICIDQSRVHERNHQVGMMASIYAGSYGTIIWLGIIRGLPNAPLLLRDSFTQDYCNAWTTAELLLAMKYVSKQEYFTRLWIVQEVVLSTRRKVLCSHPTAGPVWINWDQLWVEAKNSSHWEFPTAARYLLDDHSQETQMTLIYAIKAFSQSHCQNPHDKVYGLMGLVKEDQRLTIDYAKSLEELLLDLMGMFYKESTNDFSHSYTEYHNALVDLGTSWSIMSASLDAFLHDVWVRPKYDASQRSYEGRPWPDRHPSIKTMGYCPKGLDQGVRLKREELRPYFMNAERVVGYVEPNEWKPEKDYWWYEAYGTRYEIYGLVSSESLHDESTMHWYYGSRVRKAHRGWMSRIQLPSCVTGRRST